jgi:hypothetical protein
VECRIDSLDMVDAATWGGVFPPKRFGILGVGIYVEAQFAGHIVDRGKNAASNDVRLQFGKP